MKSVHPVANMSEYLFMFPQIGLTIANEVFPEAVNYFLDQGNDDDIDSDDSDDEDDDDDADEIDLEKPRKKQKV